MKRNPYARYTEAMCAHCTAPFEARLSELARGAGRFCSPACKYAASRGRAMTTCTCENPACGKIFERFTYATRRAKALFCSTECARVMFTHEERVALGRRGGSAPHREASPEDKFRRSSLGGQARYAIQTKARLREIARMGVAARLSKPAYLRRASARKAAKTQGKTLRWFGVPITSGATSPARGCEGSTRREPGPLRPVTNPAGARHHEEEVDV